MIMSVLKRHLEAVQRNTIFIYDTDDDIII